MSKAVDYQPRPMTNIMDAGQLCSALMSKDPWMYNKSLFLVLALNVFQVEKSLNITKMLAGLLAM